MKFLQIIAHIIGEIQNIVFKVKINKGSDIATLIDESDIYTVPAGAADIPVHVRISIPETDPPGKVYNMEFEFTSSPITQTGQFQFGSAFIQRFNVNVREKAPETPALAPETEKKISPVIIYIIIAIIIILIIIFLKRKLSSSKTSGIKSKS